MNVKLVWPTGNFILVKAGIDAVCSTGFALFFFPFIFFGPLIMEVDGFFSLRRDPHSAIPLPD